MVITRNEKHEYRDVEGNLYPSVTQIIGWCFNGGKSDALVNWATKETCNFLQQKVKDCGLLHENDVLRFIEEARKEATRKKEEAGDIGTRVHGYIEEWIKKSEDQTTCFELPPFEDEEVKQAFKAWLEFVQERDLSVVASERIVHSPKSEYAGTLDLLAFVKTDKDSPSKLLYLIDIKTSNYFYDVPNGCQLAAYKNCLPRTKEYGKLDGIAVIRLDKETGKPHWRDYTEKEAEYLETFLMFRKIYKIHKEGKKRNGRSRTRRSK